MVTKLNSLESGSAEFFSGIFCHSVHTTVAAGKLAEFPPIINASCVRLNYNNYNFTNLHGTIIYA